MILLESILGLLASEVGDSAVEVSNTHHHLHGCPIHGAEW